MVAFRRILCPVDFSDCSRRALDHAAEIARWYGGTITALHVVHPIPYADPLMAGAIVFTPEDLDPVAADLKAFVAEEIGGAPAETAVVQGSAAAVILDEARRLPANLIVLGTHGRSGFERFMLGSIAERVLRRATCPVLTVPRAAPDAVAIGPIVFREILCGVDFSPASTAALTYATSLAQESGAHLTVMHVVEPRPVYEPVMAGGSGDVSYDQLIAGAARLRLHEIVARNPGGTEVVSSGKPYRLLLDRAHEDHTDLIVIGVHGGLADRVGVFGSTTNHIVRAAACPVLSLRE